MTNRRFVMRITDLTRRASVKSLATAALLALSARAGLAQFPGQTQSGLPSPPSGPAIVMPTLQQPAAPMPLTPPAQTAPGTDAAMRAMMLDVLKQHDEEK